MTIRFTIAKRGLLSKEMEGTRTDESLQAQEEQVTTLKDAASQHLSDKLWLRSLRPRLEHRPTVDAVEFQNSSSRLPSVMPTSDLHSALGLLQRVMLHEMEKGNAVSLPGIGTFRLSLKGEIEVKDGCYHGHDVHVDDILFTPDRELLDKVRHFEVDQVPYGQVFHVDDDEINARFTELFAKQDTITHQDVRYAFELSLTRNRITPLLHRLVLEGRLISIGRGAQTRYRAAEGHFGR